MTDGGRWESAECGCWWGSRPIGGRGWRHWSRPVTGCSRSIRGRWPALGSGTAPREPTVMPGMRTRWPTWCAPTPISCPPIAGDSPLVEGIKVIARAHQNLSWDRQRQMLRLRLRGSLREFFPAALAAWPDLTAPDAVELLTAAPDPERAAGRSRSKIVAALRRDRRGNVEARAEQIQATLRGRQLTQPAELAGAYAVTGRAQVALIATLNTQITDRGEQVEAHVGRHPDAEMVALIRPDARASPRSTTRAR